jgi:hypothetical protein
MLGPRKQRHFQRFFEHIVELCNQAGLIWGQELLFDGTKVRANADIDSLRPRWYVAAKSHLEALFTALLLHLQHFGIVSEKQQQRSK